MVLFGCCLYLCDRDDLFTIASEANRLLKDEGWVIIQNFYSPVPTQKGCRHDDELYSFKMDYKKMFDWHPWYTCIYEKVAEYRVNKYSDDRDNMASLAILRKKRAEG